MNNYKVAIIITTFLRDELLYETILTIFKNCPKESIILIGDQGLVNQEKLEVIQYYQSQMSVLYFRLPFDCGLSYARNFLVNKAKEANIPYCLISADSIQFTEKYNFNPIIDFLESNKNYALVGMELLNSKANWEFNLEIKDNTLYYLESNDYINYNNINFKKIDICRNIFLAKTNTILNLWDNEMKLSEHTLAFWNLKQRGYYSFWTSHLTFKRVSDKSNEEYMSYRKRTNVYRKKAMEKLGIIKKIMPPKGKI